MDIRGAELFEECKGCSLHAVSVRNLSSCWLLSKLSFIHYTLSNPQIRCVAADILWQPSSLPCLGISSTM